MKGVKRRHINSHLHVYVYSTYNLYIILQPYHVCVCSFIMRRDVLKILRVKGRNWDDVRKAIGKRVQLIGEAGLELQHWSSGNTCHCKHFQICMLLLLLKCL